MQNLIEDIRKEAIIGKKWRIRSTNPSQYSEGLLITGPNSFIGSHIVKEALESWEGPVHILLRASTHPEAIRKMKLAFVKWQLGAFPENRVTIHLGDILQSRMGMPAKEYHEVKRNTGHVIHLAITPVYQLPYQHFRRVWIPELERMITYCTDRDHPKKLHYLSSVFTHLFNTDDDFLSVDSNAWISGYNGFKWVAARSIENAFSQGLQGCVYDVPQVLGSEKTGLCPWYSPFLRLLGIFMKNASYYPFNIPVFPVDCLASLIINCSIQDYSEYGSFYSRPMLDDQLSEKMLESVTKGILEMKETGLENIRTTLQDKMRIDFLLPQDLPELLKKLKNLKSSFPQKFDTSGLPSTSAVFMSNLNRMLSNNNSIISPIKNKKDRINT